MGKDSVEIDGKRYYRKQLHILRPKNLESMTVSFEHITIQKEYFALAQREIAELLVGKEAAYGLKRLPEDQD
jgi:hypothetical protein